MPPKGRKRASEKILPGSTSEIDDQTRLALAVERLTAITLARACDRAQTSYADFCEQVFGLVLTEAQRAVTDVIFDGKKPDPRFVKDVFGGLSEAPPAESMDTALVAAGRGSGKSLVDIAGRGIHMALTVKMDTLGKGEAALVPIVAPDQRQSRHTLSFVKGLIESKPAVARLLQYESTLDVVRIVRPDGHPVTIEARPATGGGKAVRGSSLAGVLMEEAAFFFDEGYEVSDVEIYRAARPRLLPGGQIVLGTTPWAQTGLVWDLFKDSFGHPRRAVVARAPTLLMRPSVETERMVKQERETDPDNAEREFDANFLSSDAERFFPESLIEKCLDMSFCHIPGEAILKVEAGERVRFGGDFAFDIDSSALFGFVERDRFLPCEFGEWRPTARSLVPEQVVAEASAQIRRAGGKLIVADAHYRRSIEEHLTKSSLALVHLTGTPAENFLVVRSLMAQDRVRIPNIPRFLTQLRQVRSSHKPGGQVTIHQPRMKGGGHGDIVSAFVAALAGVSLTATQPISGPKTQLEAECRAVEQNRQDRFKAQQKAQAKQDRRLMGGLRRLVGSSMLRHLRGGT
jgi:hypothetical protein